MGVVLGGVIEGEVGCDLGWLVYSAVQIGSDGGHHGCDGET